MEEYLALDRERVVPVVPLGSIEQHGPHLPMGTDTFQCELIVDSADEREPNLILATPVLWIGNSVNHLGFDATLFVDPTRYVSLLVDIGRSFLDQGFRHLLFLNGHGANIAPLGTALHQLEGDYLRERDGLQIAGATWWTLAPEVLEEVQDSPLGTTGHACEIETSLILAGHPSLVREDRFTEGSRQHPHVKWASYDFRESSRVSFVEMFHHGAPLGHIGHPELASAEKGRTLVNGIAERLVEFVRDFSTW